MVLLERVLLTLVLVFGSVCELKHEQTIQDLLEDVGEDFRFVVLLCASPTRHTRSLPFHPDLTALV